MNILFGFNNALHLKMTDDHLDAYLMCIPERSVRWLTGITIYTIVVAWLSVGSAATHVNRSEGIIDLS